MFMTIVIFLRIGFIKGSNNSGSKIDVGASSLLSKSIRDDVHNIRLHGRHNIHRDGLRNSFHSRGPHNDLLLDK